MSTATDLSAEDVLAAAALLLEARRTGRRLDGLPERLRPRTAAAAHAIQDAVQAALGEPAGAIKVNATAGGVYRGIVGASRVAASPARIPARIPARAAGMMGIEVEIAFVFADGVPPRAEGYEAGDVAGRAAAVAAFDVVDTRLEAFLSRTQLERVADALNAGHVVHGAARRDWTGLDRATPQARLTIGGRTVFDGPGRHPAGDAFAPVIAYLDTVRGTGCPPGTIITTGSFTGLAAAEAGDTVRAELDGFEPIEVAFVG